MADTTPSELTITSEATEIGNQPIAPTQQKNGDFLAMMREEFFATPFLFLLKEYLNHSNGSQRKSPETCLAEFRRKHPHAFRTVFLVDSGMKFLYLLVFFIVVVRGLGLIEFAFSFLR